MRSKRSEDCGFVQFFMSRRTPLAPQARLRQKKTSINHFQMCVCPCKLTLPCWRLVEQVDGFGVVAEIGGEERVMEHLVDELRGVLNMLHCYVIEWLLGLLVRAECTKVTSEGFIGLQDSESSEGFRKLSVSLSLLSPLKNQYAFSTRLDSKNTLNEHHDLLIRG